MVIKREHLLYREKICYDAKKVFLVCPNKTTRLPQMKT
jgi:hypothetical protein